MTVLTAQSRLGLAPAVGLAISAMVSIQLAAALSRPLVAEVGAPAVTWLRMAVAATILLALTRPILRGLTPQAMRAALLLGLALGFMSACFFAAVARLPLGLVATISFVGPLAVATLGKSGKRPLGLAALAAAGVVLSIAPLQGAGSPAWHVDPTGLILAFLSALGWAAYILLSRRVGTVFSGLDGLAISFFTAALVLTPFGMANLHALPPLWVILGIAGTALLAPLLTCGLEMVALRRLGTRCFGIMMSLEPAIAATLGLILLHEMPSPVQALGMALVILASIGAVRLGAAQD